MCNRYILNPGPEFHQRFGTVNRLNSFPKNNNAVPGQIEPIINRQEGLTLAWVMKWGLIPFWAKDRGVGDKMFNVSAESVLTKNGFRQAFRSQRCLVPASGFYLNSNFFSIDHRPLFSFAGIYDVWQEPVSGHEVYTYAIITTKSRAPIILRQSDESVWLNEKTPVSKLESLLRGSNL